MAEAGQELQTFSIGFESVGGEKGDEFMYSDIIAQHYGTTHHQIFVPTDDFLPNLPLAIDAMNEPMVSHDNIGFFLLSREVAKHVKVVQSGQGADEIHAGYRWYPPMLDSKDPYATYRQHFFDRDQADYQACVDERFHGADFSGDFVAKHFAQAGAEAGIDKALRLDTTVMLVDDPVKRVDSQTMAWGLEARVPFSTTNSSNYRRKFPEKFKCAYDGKGILKEAGRRIIPESVIDRPKGYFPVPALKYLRGPYLDLVRDALTGSSAKTARYLSQNTWKIYSKTQTNTLRHCRAASSGSAPCWSFGCSNKGSNSMGKKAKVPEFDAVNRKDARRVRQPLQENNAGRSIQPEAVSLRNWEQPDEAFQDSMRKRAIVDCGWGRIIFAHTFDKLENVAKALKRTLRLARHRPLPARSPRFIGQRAARIIPRPFAYISSGSQGFIADGITAGYRRPPRPLEKDAQAMKRLFLARHMVPVGEDRVMENAQRLGFLHGCRA